MVEKSTLRLAVALALALGLAACADTGVPTAVPVDGPRFDGGGFTGGGGLLIPSDSVNSDGTTGEGEVPPDEEEGGEPLDSRGGGFTGGGG